LVNFYVDELNFIRQRVFDSLNYTDNIKLGIDAVKKAGGVAEGQHMIIILPEM
jgi:pyruvate carboxylase